MRPLIQRSQTGFTLIEVLVTLMVFAVGLAGFAAMQTLAMREAVDTQQRSLAVWRSQELIDRIRANPDGVDDYIDEAAAFDCDVAVATVCADHHSGTAKVNAATCTTEQMAAYDVWDVMCTGAEGLEDVLIDMAATLTCADAPCADDSDLTLTLQWSSQAARANKDIEQSDSEGAPDPVGQTLVTVFRP